MQKTHFFQVIDCSYSVNNCKKRGINYANNVFLSHKFSKTIFLDIPCSAPGGHVRQMLFEQYYKDLCIFLRGFTEIYNGWLRLNTLTSSH